MNQFPWEEDMPTISPYIPGEQPRDANVIKLNTNENPYPPSPRVGSVIHNANLSSLRKYPDPTMRKMRETIASYHGVLAEQVFVGVGSDDVLATSFMTFFRHRSKPILFADITYSFYEVWADLFELSYQTIPLEDDFSILAKSYCRENGGIVIANPNAPTGLTMSPNDLCMILEENPSSIVIVDEAYIDFGGCSMLPYVEQYSNLLVVRTFSKSRSLAGSRIGYAIGHPRIISHLFAVRDSFNSYTMDCLTQEIAVASVEDEAYFEKTVNQIKKTRETAKARLRELGFVFGDSQANFIFATHPKKSAKDIFEALRARQIYVRYFDKARIDRFIRISIGTDEEMEKLFEALEEILK